MSSVGSTSSFFGLWLEDGQVPASWLLLSCARFGNPPKVQNPIKVQNPLEGS